MGARGSRGSRERGGEEDDALCHAMPCCTTMLVCSPMSIPMVVMVVVVAVLASYSSKIKNRHTRLGNM